MDHVGTDTHGFVCANFDNGGSLGKSLQVQSAVDQLVELSHRLVPETTMDVRVHQFDFARRTPHPLQTIGFGISNVLGPRQNHSEQTLDPRIGLDSPRKTVISSTNLKFHHVGEPRHR